MPDSINVSKELIEETFDGAAPSYDKMKMFKESGQRLIDLLDINRGANILDVGTGTGMALLPAARRVGPDGHVTGIDISVGMLQRAKQAALINGLSHINLLKMDAERLEFPDAFFDVVTCAFAIFYFSRTALAEMYRVCKPGGTIGLAVFEKPSTDGWKPGLIFNQLVKELGVQTFRYSWGPTRFSPEEIESLVASYGFTHKKTLRETTEVVYADLEEFWEMLLSGGSRMTVMSMDEAARGIFKKELFQRLKTLMETDGLHFSDSEIYLIAQK